MISSVLCFYYFLAKRSFLQMKVSTFDPPLRVAVEATKTQNGTVLAEHCSAFQQEQMRQECMFLLNKIDLLEKKVTSLQRKLTHTEGKSKLRKKNRRRNNELSKRYGCLEKECKKVYDSVTSLKYHMRSKHQIRIKKKRLQDVIVEVR